MDHYKVLGVSKSASKEEIKQAYRNLAMQYHPDKHALSPKHLKEAATLKFKHLSQAYDTLIDDRKRADYNISRHSNNHYSSYNYNYGGSRGGNYNYGYGYSGAAADSGVRTGGYALRMDILFKFLTSRSFLLNAAFAGVLLGATVIIDSGGKKLWEMQNSGKSFEEAMESVEKAKTLKDKM